MTIGELIISVNDNGYFVNSNSKIISDGWSDKVPLFWIFNCKS
jgi:hypothetical protein